MAKKSSNNILIGLFVVAIIIVVIIAVVRNRAKKNQVPKGQIADGIVGPQRAAIPPRMDAIKLAARKDPGIIIYKAPDFSKEPKTGPPPPRISDPNKKK